MANSIIKINFNTQELSPGDFVQFELFDAYKNESIKIIREDWVATRQSAKQISANSLVPFLDENNRFINFFELDYNSLNEFYVSIDTVNDEVVVETAFPWLEFRNFSASGATTSTIVNSTEARFEIISHSVVEDVDNCNYVKHVFQTNIPAVSWFATTLVDNFITTNFEVRFPRGDEFRISINSAKNQIIYFPYSNLSVISTTGSYGLTVNYGLLLSSNIKINVTPSVSGANVLFNVLNAFNLDLQYSLDGVNYFLSNTFANQIEGSYTVYVKDQFNCVKSTNFTVTAEGSYKPYLFISKSIPFNFVKIEDIDNVNLFRNQENTFECDGLNYINSKEETKYLKSDNPQLQLKTNAESVVLTLRKFDLTEEILFIDKKTTNLGRFIKMDCIAYQHSSGKLAVYFNEGNIYNNLDQIESMYQLFGNLPNFAKIGNFVTIDGIGSLEIYNTEVDYNINKKIILFDLDYNVTELFVTKIESIYNILEYEVYQNVFNFLNKEEGLYDILINCNFPNGEQLQVQSENFEVCVVGSGIEHYLHIMYYNDETVNRDIFYKFGLKNVLRLYCSDIESFFNQSSDININDDNVTSIKSFLNKGDKFLFEDLTTKQMETLCIALSMDNVFINGIKYVKTGDINVEKIKNTNLYQVEASMLKTGETFNTEESGYTFNDSIINQETFIPTLIFDGINLIKE